MKIFCIIEQDVPLLFEGQKTDVVIPFIAKKDGIESLGKGKTPKEALDSLLDILNREK